MISAQLNPSAGAEVYDPRGTCLGIHILLTDRENRPEEELIRLAASVGVKVYGLSGYDIHPGHGMGDSTVVLGYASLSEDEIRRGAELLNRCWARDDYRMGK